MHSGLHLFSQPGVALQVVQSMLPQSAAAERKGKLLNYLTATATSRAMYLLPPTTHPLSMTEKADSCVLNTHGTS